MQIVATCGPATEAEPVLRRVVRSADRLRLNSSHMDPEGLIAWLDRLADVFASLGRALPVVVDLQGAKMRIGAYPSVERIPDEVTLVQGASASVPLDQIPVPHPRLFAAVRPGERLTLNDARVELELLEVTEKRIRARAVRPGPLSARKGINRPRHPVPWRALEPRDRAFLEAIRPYSFVEVACSFVHAGAEAELLRAHTAARLVAKIERPEAFAHLGAIAEAFDELWLCRGDLGAQAGLSALGGLQETLAERIPELQRPVLLAGEVLQHTTVSPRPSRAEVVGLHQAQRQGYAGIVLSDETAVGRYPAEAVDGARALA